MPALRQIKRRIKTARNISQVTRAMEMVSAVKMRKSQAAALSGRPYIESLEGMVQTLARQKNLEEKHHYLSPKDEINTVSVLVIAPQKGLCGALVSNLARTILKYVDDQKAQINFVTFEKKAVDIVRLCNRPNLANFTHQEKNPTPAIIRPVADFLVKLYEEGEADQILIAYTHFVNTVTQKPVIRQFLPVVPAELAPVPENRQFLFEPTATQVLRELLLRYCEALLYQIILEALAAEHSARMVAMKNAHDNASEIINDLTLFYNKARQEAITAELTVSAK